LNDIQGLYDMLDGIKLRLQENIEPDGTCRFDIQHMHWILLLADKTLTDSIEAYRSEC